MSVVEEMDDTEDPGISLKVSYLNFNKYEFIFHNFTVITASKISHWSRCHETRRLPEAKPSVSKLLNKNVYLA